MTGLQVDENQPENEMEKERKEKDPSSDRSLWKENIQLGNLIMSCVGWWFRGSSVRQSTYTRCNEVIELNVLLRLEFLVSLFMEYICWLPN